MTSGWYFSHFLVAPDGEKVYIEVYSMDSVAQIISIIYTRSTSHIVITWLQNTHGSLKICMYDYPQIDARYKYNHFGFLSFALVVEQIFTAVGQHIVILF